MAISYNFTNVAGYGGFVFEINHISNGFFILALMFTFFLIIAISMLQFGNRELPEILTFSGFLSLVPSIILATLTYRDTAVLAVWVPILFMLIGIIGIGMMYLFEKR